MKTKQTVRLIVEVEFEIEYNEGARAELFEAVQWLDNPSKINTTKARQGDIIFNCTREARSNIILVNPKPNRVRARTGENVTQAQ